MSFLTNFDLPDDGRALGLVDWDADGDLDVWVSNRNGPQVRFLRNNLPRHDSSIALQLRGTQSNRDAVGAQVTVNLPTSSDPLRKTVRAGDGYLAQSSKWLHFGLGGDASVVEVTVRWPSGETQTYDKIAAGHRYQLVQGQPSAIRIDRPSIELRPSPRTQEAEVDEGVVHVFSVSRLPVPPLSYTTFDGTSAQLQPHRLSRPVLLNLWASWCRPCQQELNAFAKDATRFDAVGLDVIALSVDGLDGKTEIEAKELRDFLKQMGFPYQSGRADDKLVEILQLLHDFSFDMHLPLPVPTSVLIDSDGRLAAWYLGPVSVDRILEDLERLRDASESQRDSTTGFMGRWAEPLNSVSLVPILDALTQRGFLIEANAYIKRLGQPSKSELLPAISRLALACFQIDRTEDAARHASVMESIDPSFVGYQTQLAKLKEKTGDYRSAKSLYEEALRRNARDLRALNNYAWMLATCEDRSLRDGKLAQQYARIANELTGNADPNVLDTLAAAYAASGDFIKARLNAQVARRLALSKGQLQLAADIAKRLETYE